MVRNEGLLITVQCRGPQHDPACHRAPRTSPDYSKETEAEVIRACLPITRHGKDHLARHCEESKKTGKTKEAIRGADRTERSMVTDGCGRQTDGGSWLRDYWCCPYDPRGQQTGEGSWLRDY